MKQNIEIEVPQGFEAKYNPETMTVKIVKKTKSKYRSKSWNEFCQNHPNAVGEYFLTSYGDIGKTKQYEENGIKRLGQSYLKSEGDAEGIRALIQLTRLHDEWVGDWEPDWDDDKTVKWTLCYQYECLLPSLSYDTTKHCMLAFPTKKMALDFLECFYELLKKAKKFI